MKRFFITIFTLFIFGINNIFANGDIPYIDNTVVKFYNILGEKIYPSGMTTPLGIFNGILYFTGDGGSLNSYQLSNGNLNIIANGLNTNNIGVSNNYIFYIEPMNNYIYRINIDGTNPTLISNIMTNKIFIIGNNLYASQYNGSNYIGYIMDFDGNGHTNIIGSNVGGGFYNDGTYLYYSDNSKLYRTDLDGSNSIILFNGFANQINVFGGYVFFQNNGINRVNIDGSGYLKIRSNNCIYLTNNGTDLFFTNSTDGKIYKIGIDGGTESKISDLNSSYLYGSGNYIFYRGANGNTNLYKINILNPQGYGMTDNIFISNEILNTNEKVYIKTNTTLPNGTDYEFWLANQNSQIISLSEGNNDIYYMGGGMNILEDWSGMNDLSSIGVNIGDSVILFKGSNSCEKVVSQVSPWDIRFTGTCNLPDGSGYGIKKGSANFRKLNNTVLDGDTEINTQTIFGNVTDKLFYKIVLFSTDSTKTPIINSVTITATPQAVVTPPGNTGNTTSTGGINLSLGDGTSISIPAEKQTTDFIKSLATQPSINPSSLNSYSNVESFLKDNNYDYKNQILIGSGVIPDNGMYTIVNLGFTDNSLSNTLSGAINSTNYSKLVLTPETYLAGKRIINYLKMDKADDDGNLIISVYNSDTKEYIFLKPKN